VSIRAFSVVHPAETLVQLLKVIPRSFAPFVAAPYVPLVGSANIIFASVTFMFTSDLSKSETNLEPQSVTDDSDDFMFWIFTWLGTIIAGGAFGMLLFCLDGLLECLGGFIFGAIFAGIIAIPVISTFAVLSWTGWLTRFSISMAVVSGACTGIVSATLVLDVSDIIFAVCIAGPLGGVGAGISTRIYMRRHNGSKLK